MHRGLDALGTAKSASAGWGPSAWAYRASHPARCPCRSSQHPPAAPAVAGCVGAAAVRVLVAAQLVILNTLHCRYGRRQMLLVMVVWAGLEVATKHLAPCEMSRHHNP